MSDVFSADLLREIRNKFHHVDVCPYAGRRVYLENAGGSLTLKAVTARGAELGACPDNGGRDNPASEAMSQFVDQGKADLVSLLGFEKGIVFGGETGSECLFRIIRTAVLQSEAGGSIASCTLEHPASYSATREWAANTKRELIEIPFEANTATVTAEHYSAHIRPDTRVATIIHTNPITGMVMDVRAITKAIRDISPDCLIIVDGIQHAAHGSIDLADVPIDAYVVSPYKVFSTFNDGFAWISDRLSVLRHDRLAGKAENAWELGSRDPSAYAAITEIVNYLLWLGEQFTTGPGRESKLKAAGKAIADQEHALTRLILSGRNNLPGLESYESVSLIACPGRADHEGVVSFAVDGMTAQEVVAELAKDNIRIHARVDDAYSGNILRPLNLTSVSRVSLGHYNSAEEIEMFLTSMARFLAK
ncbi:MAG: aminotransferase class V-fold PLP-dependent enzyme [Granulosicoccus sp.]